MLKSNEFGCNIFFQRGSAWMTALCAGKGVAMCQTLITGRRPVVAKLVQAKQVS